MSGSWIVEGVDEARLTRLAELIALKVRAGDLITLTGDLGAGKTTFARALIRAMLGDPEAEVPSPTFTIVQPYATARIDVAHFDLYRLTDPAELDEIGFDEAVTGGLALVEWPERAEGRLHGHHLDIALSAGASAETRTLSLTPDEHWTARIERLREIDDFLADREGTVHYLQGDASTRAYARLISDGGSLVLMDSPRMPDGPPIRDGLPYSRIAHLAEDVTAFHAVAEALAACGMIVPTIRAFDHERGLLLIDDLGDLTFGRAIESGMDQQALWSAAVDGLVALRAHPPRDLLPVPGGADHFLNRFDRTALLIEVELLTDWYWPAVKGAPMPPDAKAEFLRLWNAQIDWLETLPLGWVLRDYHSPNLMWLSDGRVGVLDFQDAMRGPWAYDVVSLVQDARLDVPENVERALLVHYRSEVARREPDFDAATFDTAYAVLGAQRNNKLLGLWKRLANRDGKHGYLAHLPRTWHYLERNLRHPALADLARWFDRHFPPTARERNS
ncbi:tRNA (adenosine(37)-N6)-threonylcarbamoyltransferase complex ATPase subunit type 1 TsaE [Hyphomicrobium sp. CS1BSMeth3]|uniref:tRNA (adenosine(37)-N6)-threonylcarbamoyltransferase complex ATPase subunit type 1 TsaE n=1 Tax=Hyphomicrobium sp. CS1BSMeth3 TaxID=1892844 RepID=UPI000931EAF1|nr:tRNA (adenosine(37)-N6)-threonylcarbamoyltransferase complex ATPase subunit type 1 TsaE [Hyphomicrobium sp. CS1BSMeth3]